MIKAEDKLAFWSLGIIILIHIANISTLEDNNIIFGIIAFAFISAVLYFWIVYPLLKFWEWGKQEKCGK